MFRWITKRRRRVESPATSIPEVTSAKKSVEGPPDLCSDDGSEPSESPARLAPTPDDVKPSPSPVSHEGDVEPQENSTPPRVPRIFVEGEQVPFRRTMREDLVASGAVISPSSAISEDEVVLHHPVHVSPQSSIGRGCSIGRYSFVNWRCALFPNVSLGPFCSIGRDVQIGLARHPVDWLSTHTFQYQKSWFPRFAEYDFPRSLRNLHHPPTRIGADVWIGGGATIMSGITVGTGAIVGANAVITKDVEPYTIVGGVPARPIRKRFSQDLVDRLLTSEWWELPMSQLRELDFRDVEACLDAIERMTDTRAT